MSLSKVLEAARADLGYAESPPNSNRTKYGEAYGMNGVPWCVMALWYWFRESGERMAFFGGGKTASCGTLLRWYREQGLTIPVEDVQVGDIVLMNFHGKSDPEHCGLVVDVPARGLTNKPDFYTIEGNTSSGVYGSQDNGGCVAKKMRYGYQVVGVCRPQYQPDPVTVDDIAGRWSENDIRWCIEHSLLKGYPDGSFRPTQAVTREELAVVLRRLADK